jgi:hypothetical protein
MQIITSQVRTTISYNYTFLKDKYKTHYLKWNTYDYHTFTSSTIEFEALTFFFKNTCFQKPKRNTKGEGVFSNSSNNRLVQENNLLCGTMSKL